LPEFDLGALGWTPELAEQLEAGPRARPCRGSASRCVRRRDGRRRRPAPGCPDVCCTRASTSRWATGSGSATGSSAWCFRAGARSSGRRRAARRSTRRWPRTSTSHSSSPRSGRKLEPRRIERYLVTIWESGAVPEIILTKADRVEDPWEQVAAVEAVAMGGAGVRHQRVDRARLRRAACAACAGGDGGADRVERRRQVDARQPVRRVRADGLCRRRGPTTTRDGTRRRIAS